MAQAAQVGRFLKKTGWLPTQIITSTYARARQTAHQLLYAAEHTCPVDSLRGMTPNGDPDEMFAMLKHIPAERLLFVGHLPSIGLLACTIMPTCPGNFGNCTLAVFELNEGRPPILRHFSPVDSLI